MRKLFAMLLAVSCLAISSLATPTIDVGDLNFDPNGFGVLNIMVSGDDFIQGVNLNVQVADGGPQLGGTEVGPTIYGVSLVGAGSIFENNNTGQINSLDVCNPADPDCTAQGTPIYPIDHDQMWVAQTTTSSGFVQAGDGSGGPALLASVVFTTFGLTDGTWDLLLSGTLNGDTNFAGIPINITNGTICVGTECEQLPPLCVQRAAYGDFNCDTNVDLSDLVTLGENYNTQGDHTKGDTNQDNIIDLTDLVTLGENYNTVTPIPEPASLGLLAIGTLIAIRRR